MAVAWRDEALYAFEFLRASEGFEEVYEAASQHYERLRADPGGHRVGAQQRQVGGVMVWFVELGPPWERWMMWWTSPEPGDVLIQGLDRI